MIASTKSHSHSLSVLVADGDPDTESIYQELLPRLGHRVCSVTTGPEIRDVCRATHPDLVIADAALPQLAEAAGVFRECGTAVILVGDEPAGGTGLDGAVFAHLQRPVTESGLAAAIAVAGGLLGQTRSLRAEVAALRQQLEDRKVIERAKGSIVRRVGVTEEDAYRRLRKFASDRNLKLADVAGMVLEAEAVFRELDEYGRHA